MPATSFSRTAAAGTLAAAALLLGACATSRPPPPTLYERLGGTPKLELVVARMLDRAAADPRTQASVQGVQLAALKKSLVLQLCAVSGGGCVHVGKALLPAERDLKINDGEFHALVTMLREELDRAHVPPSAKNELLRVVAPMKRDFVDGAARRV